MAINDNELDKMIEKSREKVVNIKDKRKVRGSLSRGCWWIDNGEGKKPSFSYQYMAEYILQENYIVRYPNEDGELYVYDKNEGIYIKDKTYRRTKAIAYMLDHVSEKDVNDVKNYILSISDVKREVNTEYAVAKNGLIHYKTKEFIKFTPDIFVINKMPTNYNPDAYDEFIDQTINKVSCGHQPTIKNIHEMFAQVLYPKLLIDKILYLMGTKADNGKSTVTHMIFATFDSGGQISSVSPQRLANNNFAGSSIYGKMANIVDDLPNIEIEDAGNIKTSVTGGNLEIEEKGKGSQTIRMQTPFIIASNHYPKFKESGQQINKRLHIIPFSHSFTGKGQLSVSESTKYIYSDNAKEYVLKLAVDMLAEMLQRSGSYITENDRSDRSLELFKDNNNPLSEYLENKDINYFLTTPGSFIYTDYKAWCKSNYVWNPVDKSDFKILIENQFGIEWKKSVRYKNFGIKAGFSNKK
ncbi:hypothetical protein I7830_08840 [Mammaliicoccus sciuri]|uniref:DNA primase family protein n=1 Tax=Mammaliicoccus sciuri TaxID=1296 RepID=UPI0018DEB0C0|nr:phage/plasmid primase, P4 family [Mammaliicoccus sciuri]MCD8894284.1 hypothetical protein [Mammaliicoccus sciuri]MCD8912473.1 hypothetical protein [Mammaliicoccus sciuri]QPW13783.1 hypothetical protein I7830_08840 [Mammaliicoccus sciuri]